MKIHMDREVGRWNLTIETDNEIILSFLLLILKDDSKLFYATFFGTIHIIRNLREMPNTTVTRVYL